VKDDDNSQRDNYNQPDAVIRAIVRGCYAEGDDFGALIEVLAGTGTRESQALRLRPRDLLDEDMTKPRLMLWCSNKGKDRDPEQRTVSITPGLAKMLKARAIARGPNRPLFDRIWGMSQRFRVVLERLGLDTTLTPYTMRHSSITRQMLAGTPLRLIAFSHDTSVIEIERTYARYLNDAGDDLTRKALLADDVVPAPSNVVPLVRGGNGS
jgi:integrase